MDSRLPSIPDNIMDLPSEPKTAAQFPSPVTTDPTARGLVDGSGVEERVFPASSNEPTPASTMRSGVPRTTTPIAY